jgi:hypothetical protein
MTEFTTITKEILQSKAKELKGLDALEIRDYFFDKMPHSVYSSRYLGLLKALQNYINWYRLEHYFNNKEEADAISYGTVN